LTGRITTQCENRDQDAPVNAHGHLYWKLAILGRTGLDGQAGGEVS
jgi:hypothetical protein